MARQIDVGVADTWDIEVDNETHLFVLANGLVVSNTQGALRQKHTGGISKTRKEFAGFDVINQILQSPEVFPDRAAVAEVEGAVESVEPAPQGGTHVTVAGQKHYVAPGYAVLVKPGDRLEAGDQLSEGIVDAGDIVRLRGLGEGRRHYADRLKQALDDSGMTADRRNVELVARSAINHVTVRDPDGMAGFLPDDTASYNFLQTRYDPPAGTVASRPREAVGKFLQQPALHYSIGTRLTPRMASRLEGVGIRAVHVADEAPAFEPGMVRLREAAHHNPDWLASMHTSYLTRQLEQGAVRGQDTDVGSNIHFAPRLAIGKGFGENVSRTGKF